MPLAPLCTTVDLVLAIYAVLLGTSVIIKDYYMYLHLVVLATQLRKDEEARLCPWILNQNHCVSFSALTLYPLCMETVPKQGPEGSKSSATVLKGI